MLWAVIIGSGNKSGNVKSHRLIKIRTDSSWASTSHLNPGKDWLAATSLVEKIQFSNPITQIFGDCLLCALVLAKHWVYVTLSIPKRPFHCCPINTKQSWTWGKACVLFYFSNYFYFILCVWVSCCSSHRGHKRAMDVPELIVSWEPNCSPIQPSLSGISSFSQSLVAAAWRQMLLSWTD